MNRRFSWKWLVHGWFTRPESGALESFLTRSFFAVIVAFTLRQPVSFVVEPHPVGLLRILHALFDAPGATDHEHCRTWLTWLADDDTFAVYRNVIYLLLGVYAAGFALPVVLPVLAVMHILPFTLYDSQGYPHHGNQIVSLMLLAQSGVVLWHCIRERRLNLAPPGAVLRGWLHWHSVALIAGTYFLSVITKLIQSKGMWLWNANNFALDMVKTQRQAWLNRLSPEFAEIPATALWMLQHPWTARLVFGSGMILEIVTVFAIGNRLLALIIGASMLVMHRSIDELMGGVAFPYNELLCFVFFIGLPFGIAWLLEKIFSPAARWGLVAGVIVGVPLSWLAQTPNTHMPDISTYLQWTVNYLGVWDSQRWAEFISFIWPMAAVCAATGAVGAGIGAWLRRKRSRAARGS